MSQATQSVSQATQPTVSLPNRVGTQRIAALSALLGLLAVFAVALVLAIDAASPGTTASFAGRQPALSSDVPDVEHRVPMAVGARQTAGPDESHVAASIGTSTAPPTGGPDESAIGNSVSMRPVPPPARPDESGVAAAIAGH
jgi:hypothetical protein